MYIYLQVHQQVQACACCDRRLYKACHRCINMYGHERLMSATHVGIQHATLFAVFVFQCAHAVTALAQVHPSKCMQVHA